MASERGCASAGRAVAVVTDAPSRPDPASVAFRSTVFETIIVSGSTIDSVPSTQFAT